MCRSKALLLIFLGGLSYGAEDSAPVRLALQFQLQSPLSYRFVCEREIEIHWDSSVGSAPDRQACSKMTMKPL